MIPFTSTGLPEPTAPVLSNDEFMRSALDQPLSPMATFFEGVKGGALESYGLGTVIRDFGNAPLADVPENEPQSLVGRAVDFAVNAFPPVMAYKGYRAGFRSLAGLDQESPILDKEAYERSPYKRPNIPWEPGMTEARAASLATWDDAKQVRDFYREKRPIASFLGGFGGQALDPINYIPVGGEFLAARAGLGLMGRAIVGGAIDAAGNTAAAGLGTAGVRGSFGDDTSWQAMVSDIAMAGLIGAGFGTIGGALGKRSTARAEAELTARLGTLKRTQESRIALNEAVDGLINNDEVHLSPNGLAAVDNAAAEMRRLDEARPLGERQLESARLGEAPVEVFHGTKFDSPSFDPEHSNFNSKAVWFGFDSATAQEHLNSRGGLYRSELQPGRYWDFRDEADVQRLMARIPDEKISTGGTREDLETGLRQGNFVAVETPEVQAAMKADGYDGFLLQDYGKERPSLAIGVFSKDKFTPPEKIDRMPAGDGVGDVGALRQDANGAVLSQVTPAPGEGQTRAVNGAPRAEPAPDGLAAASTRVAKPEDVRALAEQHGVDPTTGDFVEQADLDHVAAEGRLTEADRAALDEATKTFEDGDAFAKALGAAVSCII